MLLDKEQFPSVAIEEMNRVHHEEIDMLNEIQQLLVRRSEGEDIHATLQDLLERFIEHVQAHFAAEETRMIEGEFPVYPVHKQEHDRVLGEIQQLYSQWKQSGNSDALEKYLLLVVPDWMVQHVSTMDFVTAQYLSHLLAERVEDRGTSNRVWLPVEYSGATNDTIPLLNPAWMPALRRHDGRCRDRQPQQSLGVSTSPSIPGTRHSMLVTFKVQCPAVIAPYALSS